MGNKAEKLDQMDLAKKFVGRIQATNHSRVDNPLRPYSKSEQLGMPVATGNVRMLRVFGSAVKHATDETNGGIANGPDSISEARDILDGVVGGFMDHWTLRGGATIDDLETEVEAAVRGSTYARVHPDKIHDVIAAYKRYLRGLADRRYPDFYSTSN